MYAVVRAGGQQHRVEKGERLTLTHIEGEVGTELELGEVLLLGGEGEPKVGRPVVQGAKVTAKIVAQERGPKVRVFKRRRRKGFHKTIGFRGSFTEVEITKIVG